MFIGGKYKKRKEKSAAVLLFKINTINLLIYFFLVLFYMFVYIHIFKTKLCFFLPEGDK